MANGGNARVFRADALTLRQLYRMDGNLIGFRIPVYQRTYDWREDNIQRIFEDVVNGLAGLESDPDSLTFLGTIILVDDGRKGDEPFEGTSVSVVDGQQRLTTLSLAACMLYEKLRLVDEILPVEGVKTTRDWINDETSLLRRRVINLAYGTLTDETQSFPYPRIVRDRDTRGALPREYEYRSLIGCYLKQFADHLTGGGQGTHEFTPPYHSPETERFLVNIGVVRDCVKEICAPYGDRTTELSSDMPKPVHLQKASYRNLFERLPARDAEANRVLADACDRHGEEYYQALSLLTFTSYFLDRVMLTVVRTGKQDYAFDIFDALNTTGEPLTAVDTFRPRVIQFEDGQRGYRGSPSEVEMKTVSDLIDRHESSEARQNESRDLIIRFSLYFVGQKRSRHLSDQRRFMRVGFEPPQGAKDVSYRREFVRRLAEVAGYVRRYWDRDELAQQLAADPDRELILACLALLRDMPNPLTVPPLCRYYYLAQERDNQSLFKGAVKALTAFVALRRGATGGTAGIDTDLRGLMEAGRRTDREEARPLCLGRSFENRAPSLEQLRGYLRNWLEQRKVGVVGRESWAQRVSRQPLYDRSIPLCRFLLLAAAHNARPVNEEPWKLEAARPSPEVSYLSYSRWTSSEFATIEHVAPNSHNSPGWERSIYERPELRQTLGNLSLLPEKPNSSIGNASWARKKLFFRAFAAQTEEEARRIMARAAEEHLTIGQKTEAMVLKLDHLPILKTISEVDSWDARIIEQRSQNLAESAWETIGSWIFDDAPRG